MIHRMLPRVALAVLALITGGFQLLDGHPHTLAFLAAVAQAPASHLGVQTHGQAGSLADVHHHHGLDAHHITATALDLLD